MRRPAWVVMTYVVLLLLAVMTALPNLFPSTVRSTLPDWATSQTVSLGLDLQAAHICCSPWSARISLRRDCKNCVKPLSQRCVPGT